MLVIGLTGSIGMGKSTVAGQFQKLGAKISCADQVVHKLLASDADTIAAVENYFPGVRGKKGIDRKALGARVFKDEYAMKTLEVILHPRVRRAHLRFIQKQRSLGVKLVVLDIPLLFEAGSDDLCDFTITVSAPHLVQEQRLMKRPGMTRQRIKEVLLRQMPDAEKRLRADAVILTGLGRAFSFEQVKHIVMELKCAR